MKVYVVQADNCEAYEDFWRWTEGVFSSKELADQYIEKEKIRYNSDVARIDELEDLYDEDSLSDEEFSELCSLKAYWSKASEYGLHYWIEEYEMT